MADGFRIGRVTIEGFKGFTRQREIDLRNRHAFLLGRNGNGKSSIIEAIRWGLFGSTGRPNDIVANSGYAGACRIDITLIRGGKEWRLRRTLIRGASRGSDATLFDDEGQERSIRATMPQLDSLEAGEGTHIIFAPQSAPLRRQPEDLTAFERTVFNHVGLTHPRALLSHLGKFVSDQELSERSFDEHLSTLKKRITAQLGDLEHRRGQILSAPPWLSDQPPTTIETETKTKRLIANISGDADDAPLSGLSLGALIEAAHSALHERELREQSARKEELDNVRDRLTQLRDIQTFHAEIDGQQKSLRLSREKLAGLLAGQTLDYLRDRLHAERQALDASVLKQKLAADSVELLARDEKDPVLCPVCGVEHRRADLESRLRDATEAPVPDGVAGLNALVDEVQQAERVTQEVQALAEHVATMERKLLALIDQPDLERYADQLKSDSASAVVDVLTNRESSLEGQISDEETWLDERRAELSRLEEEERYHQIQKQLHRVRVVDAEFQRVSRKYRDFVSFGESVRDIRDVVALCLTEQLELRLPSVERDLTRVFVALTRHPYYDRLVVAKHHLPRLELQVSSSHDSSGVGHATGVLNGQAESALKLVPYFALSQTDEAPTEVYLVLLDDPTQAFDGEHIEILVERLADLGRSVQVVVASQETEKFRTLLPRSFQRSGYVVVEPKNWSHTDGPELDAEYE